MLQVEHPDSTAVSGFAYDPERRELYIRYRDGDPYTYLAVPRAAFREMNKAASIGKFVNEVIKPNYRFRKGAPI
jgi:hypothetical protein